MSAPAGAAHPERRGADGLRRWRWPLIVAGPLLILIAAIYFVVIGGRSEATDNAYVQIAKVAIAPSIGGRVTEIYVTENQHVRKGALLLRLETSDLRAGLEAAEAQLAVAELEVRSQQAAYRQKQSVVREMAQTAAYTRREAARQDQLAAAGVASRQQVDAALHAAQRAREQVVAAQQEADEALARLGGRADLALESHPSVLQARAQLEQARLNLSYAQVVAPADGVVTRVDQMPIGSYLTAAQPAFWLLSGRPWVEANFKENQLAKMRVGQPVRIKIDASPDKELTGRVASFSPGAGSAFSALPAQNATGNWVKVVQRLPVRIDFDKLPPDMAGRAGLSAHVTVDVRKPSRG